MTMHVHVLKGCSPTPLANYLKALGILRLVGEQADPQARGWWDGETFRLLTKLSKEDLETFFAEQYEPTPIFNPWGGRSGYYSGSSEKTARNGLSAIETSGINRLAMFRQAISLIRCVIEEGGSEKPSADESKAIMISRIRLQMRGAGLDWLDTVLANLGDSYRGPAILGTGGNEGSGSYTAAFLAAVVECIVQRSWDHAIQSCLWSNSASLDAWNGSFLPPPSDATKRPKKEIVAGPFRQFLPSGQGSPWDLLLCFEGSIVIQSGVTRRSNSDKHRFLTSPFYFASLGMGAGSSSDMDEFVLNKGRKNPGRGEQWFPLWGTPSTFGEIQQLFREGRCSTGRRNAKNPVDAARAMCSLGATRGISSFLRYGYLQRDNLATHLAVPLGRIRVRENSSARLVEDLSDWLNRLHRSARDRNAPARLVQAERRLADAIFAALTHDHTFDRWQAILLAATEIEALQATGTGIEARPIPPLRPDWVSAVNDDSAEVRLALALGSAAASYFKGRPSDPVRHHWLPLEKGARKFKTTDKRLVNDPRVVMSGRDSIRDLAAIVERRLIESEIKGERRSRLVAAAGCGARLDDLARFVSGAVDLGKLYGLARAFMAIKWDQWGPAHLPSSASSQDMPDVSWLAIRLACLPWPLLDQRGAPADKRIVRLLLAGDAGRAVSIARQRLQSSGIRPPMQASVTNDSTAPLWAAALAFPIHKSTALRAAAILDPSLKGQLHA
ncbi:MAG: type I-U CRISPR-associated protein Csx17 [Pirellulaceae bacterium]